MRLTAVAALILLAGAAHAQTPLTGTTGPLASSPPRMAVAPAGPGTEQVAPVAAPAHHRAHRTLQERFDEANVTHDGHLTLEQARAKMPAVARDFAAIDADRKGYVTVDQIKEHTREARAARRAARKAAKAQ